MGGALIGRDSLGGGKCVIVLSCMEMYQMECMVSLMYKGSHVHPVGTRMANVMSDAFLLSFTDIPSRKGNKKFSRPDRRVRVRVRRPRGG